MNKIENKVRGLVERVKNAVNANKTAIVAAAVPFGMVASCFAADGDPAASTTTLNTIVTSDMLGGVLNEIIGLLPVILPVMIGFIALRKGISFVLNMLHSA